MVLHSSAEREKMNAHEELGSQAQRRYVQRFLEGKLELGRSCDQELELWVRFCYKQGFYAEAAALFQHINADQIDPGRYKEIKKMATVSKMKVGGGEE